MATIPLGRYLWERIKQVGVSTILGVPGDFNLDLLDHIYDVEGLRWIGNANELNASYATDGYGRVKGVPGVMVTTHGVGELSALNGVVGAHAEQVKVIHVVGQTPRLFQEKRMLIHHSIDSDPDHGVYKKMSKPARVAEAELWDAQKAPAEIDRVIRECFIQSRPVYIFFPLDIVAEHVPAERLKTPIDLSLPFEAKSQDTAIEAITQALGSSKNPALFVDALTHRHGAQDEARRLADKLKIPIFSSGMGKGIVDETHECFVGIYSGKVCAPGVGEAIEGSDLVLLLGDIPADTNAAFSRKLRPETTIKINPTDVDVKGKTYANTHIKPLLARLAETLQPMSVPMPQLPPPQQDLATIDPAKHITQKWIWPRLASFLQPHDILIADTGTASYGLAAVPFPQRDVTYITQTYYGSIGYATPCTLGAELARDELHREQGMPRGRTILVTGDGSLALTVQEISTMVAVGVKPIIFIINNGGYTIERVIHGAKQPYNAIPPSQYQFLLPLFSHPSPESSFWRVSTKEEMEKVLEDEALRAPDSVKIVEVVMEVMDAPEVLVKLVASRGPAFEKYLRENGFME
ncbi:hypothetical protein W97_02596 [Coniosporium apollinis CBS 100218]|uniref:Pyruvate decarboxylase n=1 Tax=Coniosporium apollinis (strain CBS 100218) TaxID=1168221 RepID=R7YNH7_CONA1|nr:uncharacterized protein W97_02596 [Coniosporium apollinis CBS 100218]EON63369.1 hypothetical protein W97_02596 [Coniosporium apollinis CBS 100218]